MMMTALSSKTLDFSALSELMLTFQACPLK